MLHMEINEHFYDYRTPSLVGMPSSKHLAYGFNKATEIHRDYRKNLPLKSTSPFKRKSESAV